MFTPEKIVTMRACLNLLPEPGGEVVGKCLDEIDRLRAANERLEQSRFEANSKAELHRNENIILKTNNKQLQEEAELGKTLANHIRNLPTAELDSDALILAHKVLGSKTP